jgi:uncharacterized phage protein gp47/JayE
MALPNIPTVQEIKDSIISNISQEIGQEIPLHSKAFARVLAAVLAGIMTLLYKFGYYIYKQIFTETQDDENLVKDGEERGIFRKHAEKTIIAVQMSGIAGTNIEAGIRIYNNTTGIVYQTIEQKEIDETGNAVLKCEALLVGSFANISDGTILYFVNPQVNLDDNIEVMQTLFFGVDEENIEDYRRRILAIKREKPQGGAIADYRKWALEVSEITRAFVFKQEIRNITVYILTDNLASRIPTQEKILEVENYLNDEYRKPINDEIVVGQFLEKLFDVVIIGINPDTENVKNIVQEQLDNFFWEREPRQYIGQIDVKNVISKVELIAVVINSGAYIFDIKFMLTGTSEELLNYALANNEVAKLNSLSFESI